MHIYMYVWRKISYFVFIYIYIYTYIYTNLPVSTIVRLPHPQSGDSRGQKTFLAPFAHTQTRTYDTRMLKPPSFSINTKVKGIEL